MRARIVPSRSAICVSPVMIVFHGIPGMAGVPLWTGPTCQASAVGAPTFCCIGFALSVFIDSADAAQPIIQFITLPLYFISGVFVPADTLPHWLLRLAAVFPVRHLATALLNAYNPHVTGAGFAWTDLLILAAWGVGGLLVAIRRFSWLPLDN